MCLHTLSYDRHMFLGYVFWHTDNHCSHVRLKPSGPKIAGKDQNTSLQQKISSKGHLYLTNHLEDVNSWIHFSDKKLSIGLALQFLKIFPF